MTELPDGLELFSRREFPVCKTRVIADVIAERPLWQTSVSLYGRIYGYAGHGPLDIVDVAVTEIDDPHSARVEPFIILGKDEAQELMDSLWKLGIRPSEQSELRTADGYKHLDDMRKIAFASLRKLDIEL